MDKDAYGLHPVSSHDAALCPVIKFLPGKTTFLVRVNMLPDVSEKLVPRKIMLPGVVMMNLPSPMTF